MSQVFIRAYPAYNAAATSKSRPRAKIVLDTTLAARAPILTGVVDTGLPLI
jgi:hypothetical protein